MKRTEAWFQGERWSQGEIVDMSDMPSIFHDVNSILHQTIAINAKGDIVD
jgi:hypothetical protein